MAAELTLLRSRLMVASTTDAAAARHEAENLRQRLIGRAEIAAAAAWLGRQPQLGIEVFERGAPESPRAPGRGRTGDITALLRACLVVMAVPEGVAAEFRVSVPFWSVADAVGRMRRLLGEIGDEGAGLEAFFPVVPNGAPEWERRCRSVVAARLSPGSNSRARE